MSGSPDDENVSSGAYDRVVAVELAEVHRYSLEEYHEMIESGALEDLRVELIDGYIVDMAAKTPEHENAIEWLHYWLMSAVDRERFRVRVASALTLEGSEPEPDVAVIARDAPRPYHAATATLVIEVARSSRTRDLGRKVTLYAQGEVAEYWVLDLVGRVLVVHRRPREDRYEVVFTVGEGESVTAEALALPPLELDELLAAAMA
jgi:Uma2 family endonuclease